MPSEVFYHFLNKIFDRSEREIIEVLPTYLSHLWDSKTLGMRGFNDGMNRFLSIVPSLFADIPKLCDWLARVILHLIDIGALKLDSISLNDKVTKAGYNPDEDEDASTVEEYYRLVAQLLAIQANKKSPNELKVFIMTQSRIGDQLNKMKPYILEDNLFDNIEEDLNNFEEESDVVKRKQQATVIRAIVEQDWTKFNSAL